MGQRPDYDTAQTHNGMVKRSRSFYEKRRAHQTPPTHHSRHHRIYQQLDFCGSVKMNNQYGDLHDEATVPGFELPKSPEASYSNMYLGADELSKDPPLLPSQLQSTLLSHAVASDTDAPLPQPHHATINHLYIENRVAPRSVVALGVTQRFCSKFVTVVLYKPVQRRGN